MEILKRARGHLDGELVAWNEDSTNVREEINHRTYKAGYTDRDGQPKDVPKIRSFGGLGKNRISIWPRDGNGDLIDD